MNPRTVACLLHAGLLLVSGAGQAADVAGQSLTQARMAASGERYATLAATSAALIEGRDVAGLAAYLAAVKTDAALTPAAREQLLYESVMGMTDLEPGAATRQEVRRLRDYRAVTRVVRDEHGHRESYLLYDVAAAARFVEKRWDENGARKSASRAIATSDPGLLDSYVSGGATTRRGIEEAAAGSPPEALVAYSDPLLTALRAGQPVGRLAESAAFGARDATLMRAVLEEAPPQVALSALTRMRLEDWPGQALPLLMAAAARPETASAALLRLGALSDREPRARALLIEALGGPHGASAAAAVARTGDDALIDELARRLTEADGDLARRHALAGLRLAATPRARAHLAAFAARPDAPAGLVEEIPAWLRD